MLATNAYPQQYIDDCRRQVDTRVAAYDDLAAAAREAAGAGNLHLRTAVDSFEPAFFTTLLLALEGFFVHRTRNVEGKDGNPLNEVRVLCASLMENDGVVTADKTIKLDPATSVLGFREGDQISLRRDDFAHLSAAFFSELQEKFAERPAL